MSTGDDDARIAVLVRDEHLDACELLAIRRVIVLDGEELKVVDRQMRDGHIMEDRSIGRCVRSSVERVKNPLLIGKFIGCRRNM